MVKDPRDVVALHLRALREEADLTQGELGAKIGRDQTWVSRVEKRVSEIRIDEIEAWTAACGKPARIDWSGGEPAVEAAPEQTPALRRLAALAPADLDLLATAGELLAEAPTARDRLAFEVKCWLKEAREVQVRAALAAVSANLTGALQGDDDATLAIMRRKHGVPEPAPPAATRKQREG
jgi:transcriptional regulator with XRE-family HTH domain